MVVKLGSKLSFDAPRSPNEEVAPKESEYHHNQRQPGDHQPTDEQIAFASGQSIDGRPNDERDEDGRGVDNHEREKSGEDSLLVAPQPR